jgi:hypothetical protein
MSSFSKSENNHWFMLKIFLDFSLHISEINFISYFSIKWATKEVWEYS